MANSRYVGDCPPGAPTERMHIYALPLLEVCGVGRGMSGLVCHLAQSLQRL